MLMALLRGKLSRTQENFRPPDIAPVLSVENPAA